MPRTRARGFILLFGTKTVVSDDATTPPATARCPNCQQTATILAKTARDWFTVFFLPVFPISGRHGFSVCSNCNTRFAAAPHQLTAAAHRADSVQNQRAIALYNAMRNSPANSITLQDLMHTYATLGDYDAAVSAARQFPQALESSEQCMVTLARVYLAKSDHPQALRWLATALGRNPHLAEAHYFKALTHMTGTPPDIDQAITHARAARAEGYPDADRLLRDAESRRRSE